MSLISIIILMQIPALNLQKNGSLVLQLTDDMAGIPTTPTATQAFPVYSIEGSPGCQFLDLCISSSIMN